MKFTSSWFLRVKLAVHRAKSSSLSDSHNRDTVPNVESGRNERISKEEEDLQVYQ